MNAYICALLLWLHGVTNCPVYVHVIRSPIMLTASGKIIWKKLHINEGIWFPKNATCFSNQSSNTLTFHFESSHIRCS